jgi:hypothetical protein
LQSQRGANLRRSLRALHQRHPRRNPAKHQTRCQPTNSGSHYYRVLHSPNRRWTRRPRRGRSSPQEGSARSRQRCGSCNTRSAKPSEYLDESGLQGHRAFTAGRRLRRATTIKDVSMKGRQLTDCQSSPAKRRIGNNARPSVAFRGPLAAPPASRRTGGCRRLNGPWRCAPVRS